MVFTGRRLVIIPDDPPYDAYHGADDVEEGEDIIIVETPNLGVSGGTLFQPPKAETPNLGVSGGTLFQPPKQRRPSWASLHLFSELVEAH